MTTEDFIAMLQKADPSGKAHIRWDGVPISAELKAGYYDGPFNYIDSDGNFVTSIKGDKVDIYSVDLYGFIIDKINIFKPDNYEYILSKFKFEFGGYSLRGEERKNEILKNVEVEYKYWYNSKMKRMYEWALNFIKNNSENVYYFTPRAWTTHHKHGEWEVHHNGKITHGMNGGDIDTVYNMGLFDTTVVEGKYFKYVFNKEKADNYIKTFFKDFIDQPDNE